MSESLHTNITNIPVVIQKLKFTYQEWVLVQKHIPKIQRYSLGVKIDTMFINIIELSFILLTDKNEIIVNRLLAKIDTLKLMLLILLETQGIDRDKYISLSLKIEEVGRIVFGIKKNIKTTHIMGGK